MRKLAVILLLIMLGIATADGIYTLKKGFNFRRVRPLENRITYNFNDQTSALLEQPFSYLGRGRQCFAFVSQDGKYVLKLPRTDIYHTPLWLKALPFYSYRKKLEKAHEEKREFILKSFALSFEKLPQETGVIAMHIGRTPKDGRYLKVKDNMGYTHFLPRWSSSFILQRRHPIWSHVFLNSLQNQEVEKAKILLDALIEAIKKRAKKGILNKDRSFLRNYGFDGERVIQIDVGSFFEDPKLEPHIAQHKSLFDSIDPVQEWLTEIDPKMLQYLNSLLTSPNH